MLGILASIVCVQASFLAQDGRPPADHDVFYSGPAARLVPALRRDSLPAAVGRLARHIERGDPASIHPQLYPAALAAFVALAPPRLDSLRAANVPWHLLLALATWVLARVLAGPGLALLASLLVSFHPLVLESSRRLEPQFALAATTVVGLVLLHRAATTHGPSAGGWALAAGATQGARLLLHPLAVVDVAVVGAVGCWWLVARGAGTGRWARAGLGALAMLVVADPLLPGPASIWGPTAYDFPAYLELRGHYVSPQEASRQVGGLFTPVAQGLWHRWFGPPWVLGVVVPGAVVVVRAVASSLRAKSLPPLVAVLLASLASQSVGVVLTERNGQPGLVDWQFLLPEALALLAWGLGCWGLSGRARIAAAVGAVVLSVGHGVVPLTASEGSSVEAPDLPEDDRAVFSRSGGTTDWWYRRMRSPVPGPFPAEQVAAAMRRRLGPSAHAPVQLGLLELASNMCSGETPRWDPEGPLAGARIDPWPFVQAGFGGVEVVDPHRFDDNRLFLVRWEACPGALGSPPTSPALERLVHRRFRRGRLIGPFPDAAGFSAATADDLGRKTGRGSWVWLLDVLGRRWASPVAPADMPYEYGAPTHRRPLTRPAAGPEVEGPPPPAGHTPAP